MNKGDEEDAEQEKNDPIIAHLWRVTSVEGGRGNIILMLFHPNIQNTDVSCPLFFSFWQFPNFKFLFFVYVFSFVFFRPRVIAYVIISGLYLTQQEPIKWNS